MYESWRFFHQKDANFTDFFSHLIMFWIWKKCRFIATWKSARSAINLMHTSKLLYILGSKIVRCLESLPNLVNIFYVEFKMLLCQVIWIVIFLSEEMQHRWGLFLNDPVKFRGFRYIMKRVATNTNSKESFDFYKKQQRKLKKKLTLLRRFDKCQHITHVKS